MYLHGLQRFKTIKQQTRAAYGCIPKSVSVGYDCSLGSMPALSGTTALLRWQLWLSINEPYHSILLLVPKSLGVVIFENTF